MSDGGGSWPLVEVDGGAGLAADSLPFRDQLSQQRRVFRRQILCLARVAAQIV